MNNKLYLTKHAQERIQQRGIDKQVVDYLIEVGSKHHASGGALRYTFDHKACRRLKNMISEKEYARVEKKLKMFAIVNAEGSGIITLGYITQHIRR